MKIVKPNITFTITPTKRKVTNAIVVHHAAASVCDAQTIDKWHKRNGWTGIGYHFLVRKVGGIVEIGRPLDTIGAHCLNHNADTIGICFEGDFDKEKMSAEQLKTGQELLANMLATYGKEIKIVRHKDMMATDCPGKNFPFDELISGEKSKNKKKKKYTGTLPKLPSRGFFQKGDKGEHVKLLQTFLNWYGNYGLSTDGDYGNLTYRAVMDYQRSEVLVIDGFFGRKCYERAKTVKR